MSRIAFYTSYIARQLAVRRISFVAERERIVGIIVVLVSDATTGRRATLEKKRGKDERRQCTRRMHAARRV